MIHKHPIFSKSKTFRTNAVGGIVTTQHPSSIEPNSLSNGENVWNREAVLSSRPGLVVTKNGIISDFSSMSDFNKVFYADFPFDAIPGYNRLCAVVKEVFDLRTEIDFFVADSNGAVHYLTFLEMVGANGRTVYEIKNILFIKDTPIEGSGLFVIIPIRQYNVALDLETKYVNYYEFDSEFNELNRVYPDSFYRPLILKHGFGNAVPAEISKTRTTSYPEGINILGGNFEACYTCDNSSYSFTLPTTVAQDSRVEFRLYTASSSYVTFTVPPNSTSSAVTTFMQDDITVYLDRNTGNFQFYKGNETYGVPAMLSDNGLRVFAHADTTTAAYELLSRNARPISFDNRIFLPGGENRGNKIYYSGKNLPLYYSEKNSIPVGNNNYDITALSLQNRYFIAFKERELYRLSISESKEIDRKTLFNDDSYMEMPAPTYVTNRINDSIGCDLPTTIVNCANRLVWFHSDGAVYTLFGSNLYTEGSVYELSGEISDRISGLSEERLSRVFAAEIGGYYVLGIDELLYIMDTRVSGFRYLSGHKAANKKYGGLSWFIWRAPENTCFVSAFACAGNEYFILRTYNNEIFYIAKPYGEKDIVPTKTGEKAESLPKFSLSTSIIGEPLLYGQRIEVTALSEGNADIEVFDENSVFKTAHISGSKRFRSFIIPLSYKKGGVGITIKGSGKFLLKDISYDCNERKY